MDALYERIGLFDFWVIMFPGAICSFVLIFSQRILFSLGAIVQGAFLSVPQSVSEWIVFIAASAIEGIMMQELSRLLKKRFKLCGAASGLLKAERGVFSEKEIRGFRRMFIEHGYQEGCDSESDSRMLFHRINAELQQSGIAAKYAKLSVIQNMALSLSAIMLLGALIMLAAEAVFIVRRNVTGMIACAILFVAECLFMHIFLKRSERFNRYWVRNLIFAASVKTDTEG